jgi:hypothetical protein
MATGCLDGTRSERARVMEPVGRNETRIVPIIEAHPPQYGAACDDPAMVLTGISRRQDAAGNFKTLYAYAMRDGAKRKLKRKIRQTVKAMRSGKAPRRIMCE